MQYDEYEMYFPCQEPLLDLLLESLLEPRISSVWWWLQLGREWTSFDLQLDLYAVCK